MDPNTTTNTYPFSGMGWRNAITIGGTGGSIFPLDPVNGEIIAAGYNIAPVQSASGLVSVPNITFRGIDLSNIYFNDTAWWSPRAKISGTGVSIFAGLRITPSASGPVLDAPTTVAALGSVVSSNSGYAVGNNLYDRMGGIAVVDTVDANGRVTAAHYLIPPEVVSGQVVQVASAVVDQAGSAGATTINLRMQSWGMAPGDVVVGPGISVGTTIVSIDTTSDLSHTILTLSPALTSTLPANSMLTFTITTGAPTINLALGGAGSFAIGGPVLNATWTTAPGITINAPMSVTGNVTAAGYKAGAAAGVSCAAGTVTLASLVVTNGIVTHC